MFSFSILNFFKYTSFIIIVCEQNNSVVETEYSLFTKEKCKPDAKFMQFLVQVLM